MLAGSELRRVAELRLRAARWQVILTVTGRAIVTTSKEAGKLSLTVGSSAADSCCPHITRQLRGSVGGKSSVKAVKGALRDVKLRIYVEKFAASA